MRDQENIAKQPCSRRRGGAERKPDRALPQEKIGEILRSEEFRRTDHPVCGASEASRLFINAAATPPFQGGECQKSPLLTKQIEWLASSMADAIRRIHSSSARNV